MDWMTVAVPLFLFFALLAVGVPIGFTLGICSLIGYSMVAGFNIALIRLGYISISATGNFSFAAIPLFILMGEFIVVSGMGSKLYEAAWRWVGKLPGGLAVATVLACSVVAAMTGTSTAGCVAVGVVAVTEMVKRGYSKRLACGSVVAGGTLGILIPPSIPFIIYGTLTGQSVGKLFLAGVVPGIIMMIIFSLYIVAYAVRYPDLVPRISSTVTWKERFVSLSDLWSIILIIFLVLGSMYLGVCSASEASGIGAFASMCIAFWYKKLTLHKMWEAIMRTAHICGFIFIIVTCGLYFGYYITVTGMIPKLFSTITTGFDLSGWWFLIGVNILLLILGCMMDSASIIIITTPIIYPILTSFGFDPIWYAVILALNMEAGFITPPVGLNLYTVSSLFPQIPFSDILMGSLPYVILICIGIAIVMCFPALTLWLPTLVMG